MPKEGESKLEKLSRRRVEFTERYFFEQIIMASAAALSFGWEAPKWSNEPTEGAKCNNKQLTSTPS